MTGALSFFQSVRFNQLDLLSIGDDHVFIIHRQLLLLDIQDYLSGSGLGLQRVFINVDYRLAKPEVVRSCHFLCYTIAVVVKEQR